MNFVSGYRPDLENVPRLKANSKPVACRVPANIPDEINCRSWLKIENQGSQGSCSGHMLTSALEYCNWVQTKGGIVQLSREFAYLNGQKHCGLFGQDQGGTIDGVCEAAKQDGICLETTYPYSGRYNDPPIPQAAYSEAKDHKLRNYTFLHSYREVFNFTATGLGPICCGIPWVESFARNNGVIEEQYGQEYGWHAIPLIGYSKRLDRNGNHYMELPNSHDLEWGDEGWAEIYPGLIEYWCQMGYVIIGVSDLEDFGEARSFDWKGMIG